MRIMSTARNKIFRNISLALIITITHRAKFNTIGTGK